MSRSFHFLPLSAPPDLQRANRLDRLAAPQELFLENCVAKGRTLAIELDQRPAGYAVIEDDAIVEFHVEDEGLSEAGTALEALIAQEGVKRFLVQSFDPLALSLCLARRRPRTAGILFRVIADRLFQPRSDIIASSAEHSDVAALAGLSDDFFDDRSEIIAYIDGGGLIVYRDRQVRLIGAGVMRDVIPGRAGTDIGMVVAPALRRGGYGTYIIRHLKLSCLERGLLPICGCDADNIASQRTLQRAGFASIHQLLEFTW